MANTYWKTGSDLPKREKLQWPSGGQVIGQVAIVAFVGLVWAGLLVGYLSLTGSGEQVQSTFFAKPEAVAAEVDSADTPTLQPADTSTPLPTSTPASTNTPLPTSTSAPVPGETAPPGEIAGTPTPEPSPTDPPSPTPTETPVPTDTPIPPTATSTPAENAGVSFANDVFPIIERRCLKCHGGPKDDGTLRIEEGLDMRTYAGLLAGSFNGPVIEPGDAEASYLVEQIVSGEMPKKEPRLLPGEIRTITEWINAGAPEN